MDRLTEPEYRLAANRLLARPDAWLHLSDRSPDLESLRFFPGLRRLMVTNLRLETWDGLRHVRNSLEELATGDTTLRPISIAPMASLGRLSSLRLIGPVRDAQAISELETLEKLTLRSVTVSDLRPLLPLHRLRSLDLHLSGVSALSFLPDLKSLEELELWRLRGLSDVSALGSLPRLRKLNLQAMSKVRELPSFGAASSLIWLGLESMKGIVDLAPVAEAPVIEELFLVDMPQLTPESLRPLIGHPALRHGVWGFGSTRKNVAAYDLLPLGDPPYGHPKWPSWMEAGGAGRTV